MAHLHRDRILCAESTAGNCYIQIIKGVTNLNFKMSSMKQAWTNCSFDKKYGTFDSVFGTPIGLNQASQFVFCAKRIPFKVKYIMPNNGHLE